MAAIRAYEYEISRAMISTLKGIPGVRMYGLDDVRELLESNTKMVFLTAGMGGGTGTGAAPVMALAARYTSNIIHTSLSTRNMVAPSKRTLSPNRCSRSS